MTRSTDQPEPAVASNDSRPVAQGGEEHRGRAAESPTDIPPRGWKDVVVRVKEESKEDQVVMLGAGVAFFALLALVPALVALLTLYGLAADPDTDR